MLTPGDWVRIDYRGRTIVGMIDRLQEGLCTFAFWEGGVLKFGTARLGQIGDSDPLLTNQFRAAIAVDPHYLAKFIAMASGRIEFLPGDPPPPKPKPRFVQKRLFPDEF